MLKRRVSPVIYDNVSPELLPEVEFRGRKLGESLGQIRNPVMVLYMSKTYNPVAISYLKESVADEEDEVRLTAFATLSRIESEIVERINLFKKDLEKVKGKRERFAVLFSLAELYWEIVYLNIADRELQEFYLAEAEKYALQALELKEDPRMEFLLVRIYLHKGDYDNAAEHLERAERLGFPKERLIPYLLEVLYKRGDFKRMFEVVNKFRGIMPSEPKAASIIRVWM
ncbi:tetratricopeptide repeat protein [Hydrogenivirga caldilitoris]|nr:hypothetical protein [Hydrogenivirga caldilitoris]